MFLNLNSVNFLTKKVIFEIDVFNNFLLAIHSRNTVIMDSSTFSILCVQYPKQARREARRHKSWDTSKASQSFRCTLPSSISSSQYRPTVRRIHNCYISFTIIAIRNLKCKCKHIIYCKTIDTL